MANENTIVDQSLAEENYNPFEEKTPKKRTPMERFKWAVDNIKNAFKPNDYNETSVDLKEAMTPQQYEDYQNEQKRLVDSLNELPQIDVPEVETHVEDLPQEDENEKELVIEHPSQEQPIENEPNEMVNETQGEIPSTETPQEEVVNEEELPNVMDKTQAEKILGEEIKDAPKNEGGDKTLTPDEKQNADMNELRALAQDDLEGFKYDTNMDKWTPKQKQDAIKAWRDKQPKEEVEEEPQVEPKVETPPMTDEEALREARMIAQNDLDGFEVNGKDWSKLSTKEKFQVVENFMNKDKVVGDENHYENTENNYEAYKRYPTGLRLAEDAMQGVSNIADRAERGARENLAGGTSVNNMVGKNTIPHYDYRRFFGR